MSHILTLVDGRVVMAALLMLAASVAIAGVVRSQGGPAGLTFVALASVVLVVSLTLVNRGVAVSDRGPEFDLTWWTRNWAALPSLVAFDLGWWCNAALFVPAGFVWTALTERPRIVLVVVVAAVIAIETLHATVLSGAADPGDLVANVAGVGLGVWLAERWARNSVAATEPTR